MNIQKLLKKGKNIIVELDDEVEYIIDDAAVKEMGNGVEQVKLIRVIDRTPQTVSVKRIVWALKKEGVIDYLDKEEVWAKNYSHFSW